MLGAQWPRLSPSAGSAVFERALCSISGAAPRSSPACPQALQLPEFPLSHPFLSEPRPLVPCCCLLPFLPQPFCPRASGPVRLFCRPSPPHFLPFLGGLRVPSSSVLPNLTPDPVLSQSKWHRAVFLGANPELPPQRWDLQVRSGVSTQRPQGQSGEGAAVRLSAGTDQVALHRFCSLRVLVCAFHLTGFQL